jgi:peptide/nickel transport system permease protein
MDGSAAIARDSGKGFAIGLVAVAFILAFILIAPLVLPFDPEVMSPESMLTPPSLAHWGGTDNLGRDILTRTIMGARSTLSLAMGSTVVGVGLGALIGMVAGFRRGLIDKLSMRLADAIMALPSLVLAMLSLVVFGNGPLAVLGAIAIVFVPRAARIMRIQDRCVFQDVSWSGLLQLRHELLVAHHLMLRICQQDRPK